LLEPTDSVGLVFFNELIHQIIPIQMKQLNHNLLLNKLQNHKIARGGQAKLFKALQSVAHIFQPCADRETVSAMRFIFLITEGADHLDDS